MQTLRQVGFALRPRWYHLLVLALTACSPSPDSATVSAGLINPTSTEGQVLDADIAFYEKRLAEDPMSAADRARLAALYLRRSRERASFDDVGRAADQAERSLRIREGRNESTWALLASARLALHDFEGASDAARELVRLAPERPSHRALLAEVLLEQGRYDEADSLFRTVESHSSDLSVAPRLVRWYEITGHLARARVLSSHALQLARDQNLASTEQLAWFHLRAGDMAARGGDSGVADSLYKRGLALRPGDHRLLAARARLAARGQRWQEVLRLGEAAIVTDLDPSVLGLLRDAWLASGDTVQAAGYAAAMTTSALSQPGPIHRGWGMHLVDHGEYVSEVLHRVQEELRTRRDVYGYDLEAWALHALGRHSEAWASATRALSQGTEDEQLLRRAAAIAHSVGEEDSAAVLLAKAAALQPGPLDPAAGRGR